VPTQKTSAPSERQERWLLVAVATARSSTLRVHAWRKLRSAFLEEIAYERGRGRATYAEVEESEADLERLQKWLVRVGTRDYFAASGAELPAEVAPTTGRRLRAVAGE
jgi:transposase